MTPKSQPDDTATIDRRDGAERRSAERRKQNTPAAAERRALRERRKAPRRRQIDPTTCERDYSDDEIEFMKAMDKYKRENNRPFPTWSEVLEVLRAMGYKRDTNGSA